MIIAFNKPFGVLSQFTPEPDSSYSSLAQFGLPSEVYPIGRLDADSEGLLILSDEKGLVSKLLEPLHGHRRSYWAQVEGIPNEHDLEPLRTGVEIRQHRTLPCQVKLLKQPPPVTDRIPPIRSRRAIPTSWLQITLTEGKNRQVRRMTAHIGFPTLRLIRFSSGGLTLIDVGLETGSWRVLAPFERALLLESGDGSTDR